MHWIILASSFRLVQPSINKNVNETATPFDPTAPFIIRRRPCIVNLHPPPPSKPNHYPQHIPPSPQHHTLGFATLLSTIDNQLNWAHLGILCAVIKDNGPRSDDDLTFGSIHRAPISFRTTFLRMLKRFRWS